MHDRKSADAAKWGTGGLSIVCALTVSSLGPFCGKAFHIDDPYYVWVAQHIVTNPLDYYGLSINWYGRTLPVYEMHVSPPLVTYYLALWGSMFGWSEWSLHIAYLPFALVFMASTYMVAARFCESPLLASLITLFSPVVLVTATNVMLDLPMAAFFTASVALWCAGIDSDRRSVLVLAGVAAGLSTLCKYFGITLVPLLCVYALAQRRRIRDWLPSLMIPVACLVIEQATSYALYDRSLFANAVEIAGTGANPVAYRLATGLSFTGGCIVGVTFFAVHMLPRTNRMAVALGMAGFAGCAAAIVAGSQPAGDELPLSSLVQLAIAILGGATIVGLAADDLNRERSPGSLLLVCWAMGTFAFAALANWSVTARTLLPMAPPAAILIARRMHRVALPGAGQSKWALGAPVLACAVISFAAGAADYVWAGSMRSAAHSFIGEARRQTGTIYFQGHWGWQYYMEKGECHALDTSNFSFRPGDFVASPQNNVNVEQIPAKYVYGLSTTEYPASHWLATMSRPLGAGFYSDTFGPLPFAFGKVPADPYHVILLGPPRDAMVDTGEDKPAGHP